MFKPITHALLFQMYDPNMDDEDQAWIDNIRRQYQTQAQRLFFSLSCYFTINRPSTLLKPFFSSKRSSGSEAPATASGSDAVLNCPACFTVLCIDCQRHETYKHQVTKTALCCSKCDGKSDTFGSSSIARCSS